MQWAGVSQGEEMKDWLHDCYFAAVAGDSPTFECWPAPAGGPTELLHSSILALWGMPLGEMWDLEKLAERCRVRGRWVVFLTSAPANVLGMSSFSRLGFGKWANWDRWCWVSCECYCYFVRIEEGTRDGDLSVLL